MISVGWLDPAADCWDATMLRLLLDGDLYPHGSPIEVKHHSGYASAEGAVVVVPGQYWHKHIDRINESIAEYAWVLLFKTADEEDIFDVGALDHPNMRMWVQTPRREYDCRVFGVGFTPHFTNLPQQAPDKDWPLFLSAQKTNPRRVACFDTLYRQRNWQQYITATPGFTQGMPPEEYASLMLSAKVAPAPSGVVSPDSFRVWEALEAHTIPIADAVSPVDGQTDYWWRIFGKEPPFPMLITYSDLVGYIKDQWVGWPAKANRTVAGWIQHKRRMSQWLREDLQALGAL